MADFMETSNKQDLLGNKSVEKMLDTINEKLSNVITKSDISLIRQVVIDTVNEMKEQFLSSLVKRLEILEGSVHDQASETDQLKKDLKNKQNELDEIKDKMQCIRDRVRRETETNDRVLNDLEQYSRRNNIRIYGVPGDSEKQSSQETTTKVVSLLNEKLSMSITEENIDIAHRLGQYKGKDRPVIVKFVRRQVKNEVFEKIKRLKTTNIFINHDLTWLNQQVLSSLRLKDTNAVKKCWCTDGKIFATFMDDQNGIKRFKTKEIKFVDFDYWLNLPWPGKGNPK
ncbi:uncharacterized protein LOC132735517 [Ruditapes philippinarum]|uniref:uncharacterized protein LOC132735517 n=1 Tax=Ruditapes philippinarum TaxID=129788 RepID=UPI00295C0D11|nr:uncharacterized protein LOC132735517 [Ruditapes philippinarum]